MITAETYPNILGVDALGFKREKGAGVAARPVSDRELAQHAAAGSMTAFEEL